MIHIQKEFEQGSYEWYKFRKDFITMSPPSRLMGKSTFESEVSNIISRRLREEPDPAKFQSEAMIEGDELEEIARMNYELQTGYTVYQCGFIWSRSMVGLSPDGLIDGPDHSNLPVGAIEIICPDPGNQIHHRRMDITEPKKRWQIAYYFYVIGSLQWLDFVSYSPLNTGKEMFIKRVLRADVQKDIDLEGQRVKAAELIINRFEGK